MEGLTLTSGSPVPHYPEGRPGGEIPAGARVVRPRPWAAHCAKRATLPHRTGTRDHAAEDRRVNSPSTPVGPPPAADLGNEDNGRVHCLELPFRLRDRDGTVHVEVVPNTNPEELGHRFVAVAYDEDLFRGFPCITGTITYAGAGPRAWMGWVQLIERRDVDGTVTTDVDLAPVFEQGSPLYAFGYLPTFSDFPANPDHPDGDWVAQTFLVAIPDVVRSMVLVPVTAFSWGYRLRDHRAVELFEPDRLELSVWDDRRAFLHNQHPDWTFERSDSPI